MTGYVIASSDKLTLLKTERGYRLKKDIGGTIHNIELDKAELRLLSNAYVRESMNKILFGNSDGQPDDLNMIKR